MIGLSSHPREDRLFDMYLSVKAGEAPDPRVVEHIAECTTCAARFDELTRFMDRLREDADAELDSVFTADVLQLQQQRIAHRIAAVGRSARVIHFPSPASAPAPAPHRRPVLPRWAAATAAAGLFVGVAAGLFFREGGGRIAGPARISGPVSLPAIAAPDGISSTLLHDRRPAADDGDRDDLFLTELEMAAGGPRTAELAAFDALTPHIREVRLPLVR